MKGAYHLLISLDVPAETQPAISGSLKQEGTHFPNQTYIPKSLFGPLPSHQTKRVVRRNTLHDQRRIVSSSHRPQGQSDYRFGPLRIDWVDFEHMDTTSVGKKSGVGKEKEGKKRGGPAIATFISSGTKSGSTDLPEGVVHIYRDIPKDLEVHHDVEFPALPSTPGLHKSTGSENENGTASQRIPADGVMLGVLAVPSWMTPADFLAFVAPAAEGMAHLRMIRDSAPNRSIVVIKFREENDAAEFAEAFNGKTFNSMEPEICHVVRLLSVEVDAKDSIGQAISRTAATSQGTTYELPTCPVCLERMDSAVTGLVTVPCSHTFHCTCLSKWGDSRCPVCRYSQTLRSSHPTSANTSRSTVPIPFTPSPTSHCADCPPDAPSNSNLWICLICGNIGCGRYGRAHAQAHYERTTHLYALELETQRVWDYAGDGYVHRLIQNKADGKLVELPSAASSMTMGVNGTNDRGGGPSAADALSAEKIEAIGIEYSYLLTSQLDSQRTFYEEQTTELRTQIDELRKMLEGLSEEVEKSRKDALEEMARRKKVDDERIEEVDRARIRAEKRAEKATELARTLERELKGERAVSEGLMKNLTSHKERTEKLEREKASMTDKITELEEQVRDIMFFVDARDKIEDGSGVAGEAAGGSLQVSTTDTKKKKGRKK